MNQPTVDNCVDILNDVSVQHVAFYATDNNNYNQQSQPDHGDNNESIYSEESEHIINSYAIAIHHPAYDLFPYTVINTDYENDESVPVSVSDSNDDEFLPNLASDSDYSDDSLPNLGIISYNSDNESETDLVPDLNHSEPIPVSMSESNDEYLDNYSNGSYYGYENHHHKYCNDRGSPNLYEHQLVSDHHDSVLPLMSDKPISLMPYLLSCLLSISLMLIMILCFLSCMIRLYPMLCLFFCFISLFLILNMILYNYPILCDTSVFDAMPPLLLDKPVYDDEDDSMHQFYKSCTSKPIYPVYTYQCL
jgi:hypothetical protein